MTAPKASTQEAVSLLSIAFPFQKFPDATIRLYVEALADLPAEEVAEACKRLIATREFLPTIAAIRSECAEVRLDLPAEEEAWALMQDRPTDRLPVAIREARAAVGDPWEWRTGAEHNLRRAFRQAYTAIRKRRIEEVAFGKERRTVERLAAGTDLPDERLVNRALHAGLGTPLVHDMNETLAQLPETTRVMPRPVLKRWVSRQRGHALPPPSEAEQRDAIRVLEDGPVNGELDPLYREAEAIFRDAGA